MRRIHIAGSIVPLLAFLLVPSADSQPATGLRGFTAAGAAQQREIEQKFRAVPKPENLREYMRAISAAPHHAGSPGSRKVAEYVLAQFKASGLDARIEEFEALMPYPTERFLELVAPEQYVAALKEPVVPEDPDSGDADQLPTFNAYSSDGDVTGDLVYVNYGTPDDYETLAKLGIDVKGKIVIARYGRSWRGIKPKVAYEHGAIGCIIYSDPQRRRILSGRHVSERRVSAESRRPARQRDGHADPSRRSFDAGTRCGSGYGQCRRSIVVRRHPEDPGPANLVRRCAAAAPQSRRSSRASRVARIAADHLPRR